MYFKKEKIFWLSTPAPKINLRDAPADAGKYLLLAARSAVHSMNMCFIVRTELLHA